MHRKLTVQIWLATGVMALTAVVIAVLFSRAIASVDLNQIKLLIESSKCSCKGQSINNSATLSVERPWTKEDTIRAIVKDRDEREHNAQIVHGHQ